MEPQLGPYNSHLSQEELDLQHSNEVSPLERKGLRYAGLVFLILCALLAWTVVPENGIYVIQNRFSHRFTILKIDRCLYLHSLCYSGYGLWDCDKSIRSEKDVVNAMAEAMSTLGLYLVIIFFASQFVAFFNWTNIGQYIAVKALTS